MNKKNSLAKIVLLTLEKTVDGYVKFDDFIHNPLLERPVKKSELALVFKRLRENGFVELISDEELAARITDEGKTKALWAKMKLEDEKWDGKWRIIMWDIPEKRRKARDLLRHQLKQLGFIRFQNSIWVSKKNCADLLNEYIKKVGIDEWVSIFESSTIKF